MWSPGSCGFSSRACDRRSAIALLKCKEGIVPRRCLSLQGARWRSMEASQSQNRLLQGLSCPRGEVSQNKDNRDIEAHINHIKSVQNFVPCPSCTSCQHCRSPDIEDLPLQANNID